MRHPTQLHAYFEGNVVGDGKIWFANVISQCVRISLLCYKYILVISDLILLITYQWSLPTQHELGQLAW